MTIEYGVTAEGFRARRLIDVKEQLENEFIGEFGDINLDAQSVTGQLIGIYAKVLADIWENLEDVYFSQYPNSASGIALDNVVQLNGITRLPAQRTTVVGAATGTEGTIIPANSLARILSTGEVFFSSASATITRSNSIRNIVEVTALVAAPYTVVINSTSYVYSLPVMTFTGAFVSGNVIDMRINGVNLPSVTYATSDANTRTLIATSLETSPAVLSATVVGDTIELVANDGFQLVVGVPSITGGISQPTYALSYAVPATLDEVAEGLSDIIDLVDIVTSTYVSGATFTIQAASSENPYSLSVGSNLQVNQTTSPVLFLAQSFGPVAAPAGTLTEILTPVAGWTSLTNFSAGVTGRNQETDAELRIRRFNSLRILGAGTVEAIRARLLQEVPGVTSVLIFENITMTQSDIEVLFNADFITGNTITAQVDGVNLATVPFTTNQLTTINLVAGILQNTDEIKTVTVGGVGNRLLTIEMEESAVIEVDFEILGGASQTTFTISGGRPPKSYEVVIEGGSDQAIGDNMWLTKPAGIQTFGSTTVVVTDSQGTSQPISFSRATPIYLWATAVLVLNPQETFPANGQLLVAQAIVDYGNRLGIGVDVFVQRVEAQAFLVPGIGSVTVQLASTLNPSDTPSYSGADVDIGSTQVSVWDISRITVSI